MNVLFENPLATMDGPYFLMLYGVVISFTLIILAIVKSQMDKSDKMNLPPIPAQIDPYEIAYLRGGTNEIARSVIFSLMQKGLIEIKTEGKKSEIVRANPQTDRSDSNQIEKIALNWIVLRRESKDVFDSTYGLVPQLESYGKNYQARLERAQMLTDENIRRSFAPMKWAAFLIIFGLGAYKLFVAVANGNFNVIFLVIFAAIGLVIAKYISKLPRLTKLGKTYLERLQMVFENLKNQPQNLNLQSGQTVNSPQAAFAGVDPLLLSVGIFGSAVLAGTAFDTYNQAFARQQQPQNASGGCGGGCGSCSSCSSGDSGGSSCGGGCGGCGGGCS